MLVGGAGAKTIMVHFIVCLELKFSHVKADIILNTLRLTKITLKIKTFVILLGFCALYLN